MSRKGSLHITRTVDGVWYYQRWLPKRVSDRHPHTPPIFRVSLRTKNKSSALQLSRLISVKIDQLATDHFDDPDDFGRAMKLLHESVTALAQSNSFEEYEEAFLMDLEEQDEWLLSKANRFSTRIRSEFQRLQQEIAALREALNNTPSVHDTEELLRKIQETIHPPLSESENPSLGQLFDKWKQAKKGSMVETSYEQSVKPAIELFISFVDDFEGAPVRVADLCPEHIRQYQTFYQAIPKRAPTKGRTISELIRLDGPRKGANTIKQNYSTIGTFLGWISSKGYKIDTNLVNILTKGADVSADEKSAIDRKPFTDEDLRKLFNSEAYATGKLKTSAMYWAPLIALFTGARMSEILQLERQDIKKVDSIWTVSFEDGGLETTDNHKRLKAKGSRRQVPVHSHLLDLGFIDYVETRKNRLFPDEERNEIGKFDAFQKRQTYYRKKFGVVPAHSMERKDFHSFRHTVRTRLSEIKSTGKANQRFDEGLIDAIVGHASKDRSIGQKLYNHSQYIKTKSQALNRLQYPTIDFTKIISWRKCEFVRKPFREQTRKRMNTTKSKATNTAKNAG